LVTKWPLRDRVREILAQALAQFTGTRFQRAIFKFHRVIGLVANPVVRPAFWWPFLGYEEGGL
jgi:hypothetical protein